MQSEIVTGTTSTHGVLQIASGTSRKVVYAYSNGFVLIPFVSGGHTFVKALTVAGLAVANGEQISVTYYYFTFA